ncbi:MAG: type II toxin-antitoxin system HicB family antitoxin [Candidatus Hydrogenedentes bacterium]|nr:type II toxin-antitoxin system HicB family antitoxin [Candidatus Hydrogenedentota bacterium]
MDASYTAVIKEDSGWWIGWIEEIPGVNSQGRTREELRENLRSALSEALEFNRAEALALVGSAYTEEQILL